MNIQKLLPHEFRKYFSRFNLLFLAAVLLLELGVSLYRNRTFFRAEYREYKRETERLVEMYASDRASYDAIHTEYEQRLSAYNEDLMASDITNEIPVFESRYLENALYDDRALFSAVEKAVRTPETYQRLALAQAVLGDPEILILDEPTAGLDPKQRIAIRNYIAKIAFDKIVLIATHIMPDIEFIAKDIILLKKGVIADNAPPHQLTKKIEGKVWNVPCEETDVQRMQDTYRVTNISRDDEHGDVILRILAEEEPKNDAKAAAPTLEDYYLYVFGDVEGSIAVP